MMTICIGTIFCSTAYNAISINLSGSLKSTWTTGHRSYIIFIGSLSEGNLVSHFS
jgi:hypothetical protein